MTSGVDVVVGRRLKARRRLLGITQEALARDCGVTFQQIQKYEGAISRVSAHMLWKLACALQVEINYFFAGLSKDDLVEPQVHPLNPADMAAPESRPNPELRPPELRAASGF